MRKILTLLFLGTCSILSHAQTLTLTTTQPACNNDGIIDATITGLTPPLTVTWYMAGQSPIVHTGITSTDQITNYHGGQMFVVAVDGSQNTASDNIYQPPFTYTTSTTNAACPANGTGTAVVTGGTPPYSYNWYDINTTATISTSNPASLPGGSYGILITDGAGCVYGTPAEQDSIYVYDIPAFSVPVTATQANCTNGTAQVGSITGGTPPYSYLWNNAATTSGISGLVQGYYTVVVTDANGCSNNGGASVTQAITIGANVTTTPATCLQNDGAAISFGSGGMPPYTYLWSNTATTQGITGLAGGFYDVIVTDANGCFGNGYAYIGITSPVTATYTTTPSSCTTPTGSATLSISGGTPPYTTVWSTFPVQTGTTASGLPAGSYSFTVTDAVGCLRTGTVAIAPVNVITASFTATNPTCVAANGSLTATPSGGTSPYTYLWNNSATTQTVTGLTAGYKTVTITDAAGCTAYKYYNLPSTTPISLGFNTTQASCIFTNDGAVTVTPSGGTAPYTYSWSTGGTTNTISSLADGMYSVHVTDVNGCTRTNWVNVPYNQSSNSCYCTVEGNVYDDANSNCTQDLGEDGIINIQMHLTGVGYTYTDSFGHYSFIVPTGTYTLSETVQSFYPLSGCQNNLITVNATASSGCTITNDFGNSINPIHSVRVSSTHSAPPVPGNTYHLNTVITNQGTVPEAGLMAGFKSDAQLLSPVFVPSGYYTGGTGNWYDIATGTVNLPAGGSLAVTKDYTVPTNIPMGTSLVFKDSTSYTTPMSNWLNDYSPWNNVSYYQPVVVSSYDPNFKEVSPKGFGTSGTIFPQDSVLEYTVHFQNMGTWQAQNIVVLDTIDADLDLSTLRPIYSSHPADVSVSETGVLKYQFNNINLPAEIQDEPRSHGYFIYSIEVKPNLAQGTQFRNSASIYFDYNAPVKTNTTLNTLGWPTNVNNTNEVSGSNTFAIYPNPANDMFYAMISNDNDGAAAITLVDISGKTVISRPLSAQKGSQIVSVDVSALTPGVYFVTYTANGTKQTQKLVIMQ